MIFIIKRKYMQFKEMKSNNIYYNWFNQPSNL